MSTYPVDIKTVNITTATTTTIFNGPDDTTALWVVNTPATNTSDYLSPVFGHIMLPGTGIRADTSLKVTNAVVTHVTVYYG